MTFHVTICQVLENLDLGGLLCSELTPYSKNVILLQNRDGNGAGRGRRMGSSPLPRMDFSCPIPAPPRMTGKISCPIPAP